MKDQNRQSSALNYRDAGVNIDAGNQLVDRIKPHTHRTLRPGVLGGVGGFGALFELPLDRYRQPVLVSGTDGVGTKLKLALELQCHDTIGIDLVAMCVNDVLVAGAEPLFFLDYYATAKLDVDVAADVVKGIAEGCVQAGAALIGGETAEMPGVYHDGDYDLAGFCVGVVEKSQLIDHRQVQPGDVLLGLASSGVHSNGYSLIRKIIEHSDTRLNDLFEGSTLGKVLLAPTRIYVKPVLKLLDQIKVHAIAHITGGGLTENLPRVLPENTRAIIDTKSWSCPAIFQWIQTEGGVAETEMWRTFNCGVGLVICVAADHADQAQAVLGAMGETVWALGRIVADKGQPSVEFQ